MATMGWWRTASPTTISSACEPLHAMCARLATARRYGETVRACLAAVRAERLRESAHHALIQALLAQGNRSRARLEVATHFSRANSAAGRRLPCRREIRQPIDAETSGPGWNVTDQPDCRRS